ncbi:hypothetical protein NKH77_47825 [Streptomyces sp. M19]
MCTRPGGAVSRSSTALGHGARPQPRRRVPRRLAECGLGYDGSLVVHTEFGIESGAEAVERLLAARPDAVFCANDQLALGAARALHARGCASRRTSPSPGWTTASSPRRAGPADQRRPGLHRTRQARRGTPPGAPGGTGRRAPGRSRTTTALPASSSAPPPRKRRPPVESTRSP